MFAWRCRVDRIRNVALPARLESVSSVHAKGTAMESPRRVIGIPSSRSLG